MAANHMWEAENTVAICANADESTPLLSASGQVNMTDKVVAISQQTLVSTDGQLSSHGKKLPQYLAALAATLGALAAGMVLGWSSPAGKDGKDLQDQYGIKMSAEEFSWIGSLATLGAGVMCVPIGILADLVGRRISMLLMVVPFCIGWLLIIFANTVGMFYAGRFITGVSGGAFCVAAPLYTAEIAESEIRGTLGSYFQLLLTSGILLTYIFGKFVSMQVLSIISAVVPLIFFGVFFFMPETPFYYLKKGNEDAARKSLIKLRGLHYDIETELQMQRELIEETKRNRVSFSVAIQSKAAKKGFVIAFGLMLFQQMSGVNAIIFYSANIFEESGSTLEPNTATIIVGVVQVLAVFVSTLVVDRLGRRILLLSSIVILMITTLVMGIYFYCKVNTDAFKGIEWFAIIPLCVFLIMFNLGFGPLPWMMMAEIFAPEVKGIAASSACFLNWIVAFIVTKFYKDMTLALQPYGTFWIFSGFCAVGIFFVYFLVPETRGKTLDEIQRELNQN